MRSSENQPAVKYTPARLTALVQQVSQRQLKRAEALEEQARWETRGDAQTARIRAIYAALMTYGHWTGQRA